MKFYNKKRIKGFTLIELLVVVAIISLLSSIVFSSLNGARSKARDAQRKSDLIQMRNALELCYLNNCAFTGEYLTTDGWILPPPVADTIYNYLVNGSIRYLSELPKDPKNGYTYHYWRKSSDVNGIIPPSGPDVCEGIPTDKNKYAFYAGLENISTSDPNYVSSTVGGDSFDRCIVANWTHLNYRIGN